MKAAMKAAFPHTLPILTGFIVLGMAFGVLMEAKGFSIVWAMVMSVCTFAGSMQFVAVTVLCSAFSPFYAFCLALMVNARHLFYGISMLEKFRNTGKYKNFLIFSLCDETFSVLSSVKPPNDVDPSKFMFSIAFLDYCYWWIGTLLGCILGNFITFNTEGLDFVLTALFAVIFLNQWESLKDHKIPVIGVLCSIITLVLFGAEQFLIPAMGLILVALLWFRREGKVGDTYE